MRTGEAGREAGEGWVSGSKARPGSAQLSARNAFKFGDGSSHYAGHSGQLFCYVLLLCIVQYLYHP